ncbi:MAG: UbiX family flavin prenyltransferase [Halioglobus sp.]
MSGRESDKRLIIGISGASGAIYGIRMLEVLRDVEIETHLVMSRAAKLTVTMETDYSVAQVEALADVVYSPADVGAACASGSFKTMGMVVAPCSIKSLSEVANGMSSNLLSRAADVCLKERRRLVLMLRETPLHAGHIRLMAQATDMGAIISPPVPGFYANPESLEDMVDHTIGRVLDLFDIEAGIVRRWQGVSPE